MTKRKKLSPQLNLLVDKLTDLFDVRAWDMGFQFPTEPHETAAAEIKTDEKYQRIIIILYPDFFTAPIEKQREYILHEFCHLITNGMLRLLDEMTKEGKHVTPTQVSFEVERATSRMTSILDGFLIGGWREKKKAYVDYIKEPKAKKRLART